MKLQEIIDLTESIGLDKIPRKRIIHDLKSLNSDIRDKIVDIKKNKEEIDITFNSNPYNIILTLPKYYPFRPVTCQVIFVPKFKNSYISKILAQKLPGDLVANYKRKEGVWKFINNNKILDAKYFINKINKDKPEFYHKISEYNSIYVDWLPGCILEQTLNKYLSCLEPHITL